MPRSYLYPKILSENYCFKKEIKSRKVFCYTINCPLLFSTLLYVNNEMSHYYFVCFYLSHF